MDLLYLYCVTDKVPKLSRSAIEMKAGSRPLLDGMAGKEVEGLVDNLSFIYHQGLYALISRVSEEEFSEENLKRNLTDLEWVKQKANIHEKIIEEIMKHTCVVPFKFATLFNSEDNLKAMLKKHAQMFRENLKNLRQKEEWGVKIYCDIEKLKKNLIQEDKELLNIDKEISSSSAGKAFILKKKKEELLSAIVNKKLNEYGQESFERLDQHSIQSRINKLLPKEVTERKDDMILNSAFLVDKNKVNAFVSIVDILKAQYEDCGLFFDYTGPWPAYNFCQMKMETYG